MSYIIPIDNGSFVSAKNGWFCVSCAGTHESLGYYWWIMVGYRVPGYLTWSADNKSGRPAKGKRKLSALETAQGMKRKPKYLTRFCQICRGFSHRTIDCWLQEKNKEHRPQAWKGQLAQEMNEALEEAEVEVAMRISADPLPVGAGDWQGWCDGNGDEEEGTAD